MTTARKYAGATRRPASASCRFYSPADATLLSDSAGDVVRVCAEAGIVTGIERFEHIGDGRWR